MRAARRTTNRVRQVHTGDLLEATEVLQQVVSRHPAHPDAYLLLGEIFEKQGKIMNAQSLYRMALSQEAMPVQARQVIDAKLKRLSSE